jgi:hypothetical protein
LSVALFAHKKLITSLWLLGVLGLVTLLPAVPQLLAVQPQAPAIPLALILLITALQGGVFIFGAVLLGAVFSSRVNLAAPVINAILNREPVVDRIKPQIIPSVIGGIVGGILILIIASQFYPYLPKDFLAAAKDLAIPWYAKIFYGGISEEILLRWGVMSFLVWLSFKTFQRNKATIRSSNYVIAIVLAAFIFGLGHLPTAYALSSLVTAPLIGYIIIGNMSFGLIAGWLYWKYGLECAIFSHMVAHLTMILLEPVFI